MRVLGLALLACAGSLVGCADVTTTRPAALKEPIFAVLPANNSVFESDFASTVERDLLKYGVRVVTRPSVKAVLIDVADAGAAAADSSGTMSIATGAQSKSASTRETIDSAALAEDDSRTVDSFLQLSETSANYRINSYATTRQLEIVDLSNQQVLSVPVYGKGRLEAALTAMGFATTGTAGDALPAQASPVFTVIPTSDLLGDTPFSMRMESLLIRLGLHVVRPPAPHYRIESTEFEKASAKGRGKKAALVAASAKKVESYWVYEESPADYILETTLYRQRVKIIRKSTSEVLSVVEIPDKDSDGAAKRLREALDKLHIAGSQT